MSDEYNFTRIRSNRKSSFTPAVIENGVCYPIKVFKAMTGMGDKSIQTAKKQGLKVRKIGKLCFIRGDDFFEFLGGVEPVTISTGSENE